MQLFGGSLRSAAATYVVVDLDLAGWQDLWTEAYTAKTVRD